MKDLAGQQSPLGDHRTQLSPLPSFQPPAQAWAEFLLVVSRWLGRQEVRCWEGVRCEGLGEERKLPGQGVLGLSDDPSPSSFLALGVRANLLPARAPSSGPEMRVRYLKLGLVAVCLLTCGWWPPFWTRSPARMTLRRSPGSAKGPATAPGTLRKCICSSGAHGVLYLPPHSGRVCLV